MTKHGFSTTDVYLTAALAANGLRPDNVSVSGSRMTFTWESDEARAKADAYYAKTLAVDARTYADEIRSVKTLLHNPV